MSILPSRFRSTCLQVRTSVCWPPTFTDLKNFQTSGFLSPLRSDVTTCLSLSLHFSRSTRGGAGTFDALETISACLGVDPHPSVRKPASDRAAETTAITRVLDISMGATVGRNGRFIKCEGPEPRAVLDRRPMVMHGHAMA